MQDSVYDDAGWRDLHPDTPIKAITEQEARDQAVECWVSGHMGAARAYMRLAEARFLARERVNIQHLSGEGRWPTHGDFRADDDPTW